MGGWPLTARRSHRRRLPKPTQRERHLLAWLELVTQDPVVAHLSKRVIGMHADLIAWMAEAERARVLPTPTLGGSVSQSREPDDRMLTIVEERLELGGDPERLDPVRQRLADRLGRDAAWYLKTTGEVDWDYREPLAVRLGDLIGDQIAANALATSLLCHARLAPAAWERERKAARERWRRQATRYVQILDEQRIKVDRPMVQTVEGEGERRFG
jgi:hypothetical protein